MTKLLIKLKIIVKITNTINFLLIYTVLNWFSNHTYPLRHRQPLLVYGDVLFRQMAVGSPHSHRAMLRPPSAVRWFLHIPASRSWCLLKTDDIHPPKMGYPFTFHALYPNGDAILVILSVYHLIWCFVCRREAPFLCKFYIKKKKPCVIKERASKTAWTHYLRVPCGTLRTTPFDSVNIGLLVPVPSDRYERYHASAPYGTIRPLQRYHFSDILKWQIFFINQCL